MAKSDLFVEADWTSEAGYRCVALWNNELGFRTGYVRVPGDHPLANRDEEEEGVADLDVHGNVTWSQPTLPQKKLYIEGKWWWFGFDCAHAGDGVASAPSSLLSHYPVRSLDYVVQNCESLAKQLHEAAQKTA